MKQKLTPAQVAAKKRAAEQPKTKNVIEQLPANHATQEPRTIYRRATWQRVTIEKRGDVFDVLHAVCLTHITPSTLKYYDLNPTFQTSGLLLEAALICGDRIEAAILNKT